MTSFTRRALRSVLLISVVSIAYNPLFSSQPPTPEIDPVILAQIEQEFTGTLMAQAAQFPIMINHIVDMIAGLVQNNHIKQLHNKNKRPVITNLQELRMLIHSVLQDFAQITAHSDFDMKIIFTYKTVELCDEIVTYLAKNIQKNLVSMHSFDPAVVMRREIPTDLSFETIQQLVQKVQKKIALLSQRASQVGLVWYNKVARQFDNYIVSPMAKYDIPTTAFIIGLTGVVVTLCAWKFGKHYMDTKKWETVKASDDYQLWTVLANDGHVDTSPKTYFDYLRDFVRANNIMKKGGDIKPELFSAIYKMGNDGENPDNPFGPYFSEQIYENILKQYEENTKGLFATSLKKLYNFFGKPYTISTIGNVVPDESGIAAVFDHFASSMPNFPYIFSLSGVCYLAYKGFWSGDGKLHGVGRTINNFIYEKWNDLRGGMFSAQGMKDNYVWDFVPTVTFEDMIGLDEVKENFSLIVKFLENPEQYLLMNTAPHRGYILTGPTRTGKSFSFECLCGEIANMLKRLGREGQFKFWKIESSLVFQYSIKYILEVAKDNAPMVLFIDEIDLLQLQRVGNAQLLADFLLSLGTTLDQDPQKMVILITATNKPEALDHALRQFGRLGKEIRFEYPNYKYRKKYLVHKMGGLAFDPTFFNLDRLVQKTEGRSFEQLSAVIASSIIRSWVKNEPLSQSIIEETIDAELRRIITAERKNLSEKDVATLAAHFAGHALVAHLLPIEGSLDEVTIYPIYPDLQEEGHWEDLVKKDEKDKQKKIVYGGIFKKYLSDTIYMASYTETVNEIKALLAGFAAEEIILGSCGYMCHADKRKFAYKLAEDLIYGGLKKENLPKAQCSQFDQEAFTLFNACKTDVHVFLLEHKDALVRIANALQEHSLLTDTDITKLVDNTFDVPETAAVTTPEKVANTENNGELSETADADASIVTPAVGLEVEPAYLPPLG
jgi:cell division protease FtsH